MGNIVPPAAPQWEVSMTRERGRVTDRDRAKARVRVRDMGRVRCRVSVRDRVRV